MSNVNTDNLQAAGKILLVLGLMVTGPAVAAIGTPLMLLKAAVHGLILNYHWRMSENANGIAVNNATSWSVFQVQDLPRLMHELKRAEQVDEMRRSLIEAERLAKLFIPIAGVVFALGTEEFEETPHYLESLDYQLEIQNRIRGLSAVQVIDIT